MEHAKEELFNQWFSLEAIKGETVRTRIRCHHAALGSHFRSLYQKYTGLISYEDLIAECMYWTFTALHKFTLQDSGDTWEGLVDGTDNKNLGRLINYIKSSVEAMAMDFVNPNSLRTSRSVDGKKTYIRMVFRYSSIDAPRLSGGEPDDTIMNSLESDSNLFVQREAEYERSAFEEWFLSENQTFLTKRQSELIKVLPETLNDGEFSFNSELVKTEANIKHRKNLTHLLNRIRTTTTTEWEAKQKTMSGAPRVVTDRENKLKTYLTLLEDEDTTDSNIQNWVAQACQQEWLEDICQAGLKAEHLKNLNRCLKGLEDMKRPTLYAVNENLVLAAETFEAYVKEATPRPTQPLTPKEEQKVVLNKNPGTKKVYYFDTYGNEIQYRDHAENTLLGVTNTDK